MAKLSRRPQTVVRTLFVSESIIAIDLRFDIVQQLRGL